jgi:hypothetical protein
MDKLSKYFVSSMAISDNEGQVAKPLNLVFVLFSIALKASTAVNLH